MATASSNSPRARADRLEVGRPHQPHAGGLRLDERVAALRDRLEARSDARQASQMRDTVREARGHVKDRQPTDVSDRTASRYAAVVNQMRSSGQRPEDASCKASFEFRRAAVVHDARSAIKTGLRDLDKARRAGDLDRAADAFNRVRSGLETLRRHPPSTGSRAADLQRESAYRGPSRSDRSNGKRDSLASLPGDWRDRVQLEARSHDKAAIAAMSLTGCRPTEVKGIKVRQDDVRITLEIRGAKFDEDRGVKSRVIQIEKSELEQTAAGRDLADWLGNRECRTVSHQGTVEAFRERVARACDRAGCEQATAYSFRHAEARDLKTEGVGREEIARRLGHRSDRSQSVYG